jgi:hypothetical protein
MDGELAGRTERLGYVPKEIGQNGPIECYLRGGKFAVKRIVIAKTNVRWSTIKAWIDDGVVTTRTK